MNRVWIVSSYFMFADGTDGHDVHAFRSEGSADRFLNQMITTIQNDFSFGGELEICRDDNGEIYNVHWDSDDPEEGGVYDIIINCIPIN